MFASPRTLTVCVCLCCAEADPDPRQQQPVSGQGQRGGQPGAQCQRLHTRALPTVAAPQRHTTRGVLTTQHPLTNTHSHTHTVARSKQSQEGMMFFKNGHQERKDFPCGDLGGRSGQSQIRGRSVFGPPQSDTQGTTPSWRRRMLFSVCF